MAADPNPSSRRIRQGFVREEATGLSPTPVPAAAAAAVERAAWDRICFYSTAIKDEGTSEREHSDGFMKTLVRPAVATVDKALKVVRANELASSSISTSIHEHIFKAGLLIADLSFLNENVLLEIGTRQATGKPYVLISRQQDELPSNLGDERIVGIDTASPWRYQSQLDARIAEVAERVRWVLSPDWRRTHPIQTRVPDYREYME